MLFVSQAAALAKDWICPNCLSDQTSQRFGGSFSSLIKKGARQGVTYHSPRCQFGSPVRRKDAEGTPQGRRLRGPGITIGQLPGTQPRLLLTRRRPLRASELISGWVRICRLVPEQSRLWRSVGALCRSRSPVLNSRPVAPEPFLGWQPTRFRARSGKHAKDRANSFRGRKLWPGGPQDPVSAMVFALAPRGWRPASVPMNSYGVARLRSRGFACACG